MLEHKTCKRCGAKFEPADERDWYCAECVGEILTGIREKRREPKGEG